MDENKRKINYQPNIEYTEDYYSNYNDVKTDRNIPIELTPDDGSINETITNNIQDNIDNLISMIPILPVQLQTVVNQVFKPIFNDWYNGLNKKNYPSYIPDDGTIITPKPPSYPGDTGGGGVEGGDGGSGGGYTDGYQEPIWPTPPPNPPIHEPIIYTPDPGNPIIPEPTIKDPAFPCGKHTRF